MKISFNKVQFQYSNSTELLPPVSFELNNYGAYCLRGKNGIGKSTLLKILLKIYVSYSGSIKIDNTELRNISRKEITNIIEICYQDPLIFHDTVQNNILLKRENRLSCNEMNTIIELLDKNYFIRENWDSSRIIEETSISGGQQQLISILRTIFSNKSILIFDEPTSNLDIASRDQFIKLINLIKRTHMVLVVSHDNEFLKNFSIIDI